MGIFPSSHFFLNLWRVSRLKTFTGKVFHRLNRYCIKDYFHSFILNLMLVLFDAFYFWCFWKRLLFAFSMPLPILHTFIIFPAHLSLFRLKNIQLCIFSSYKSHIISLNITSSLLCIFAILSYFFWNRKARTEQVFKIQMYQRFNCGITGLPLLNSIHFDIVPGLLFAFLTTIDN